MPQPKAIATLRKLGYEVEESHPGTDLAPPTYYVAGHGVAVYLSEDDAEGWASLTDEAAHNERVAQAKGESDPMAEAVAAAERAED